MSVKEVLQSLVDDDMVESEKVGSSTYYWSFPSKALNVRTQKLQNLKRVLEETEKELQSFQAEVVAAKKTRKDSVLLLLFNFFCVFNFTPNCYS